MCIRMRQLSNETDFVYDCHILPVNLKKFCNFSKKTAKFFLPNQ
jgi:hypothetical protein